MNNNTITIIISKNYHHKKLLLNAIIYKNIRIFVYFLSTLNKQKIFNEACNKNNAEYAQFLLKYVEPTDKNLRDACKNGCSNVVKILLKDGRLDLNNGGNGFFIFPDIVPICIAVINKKNDVVNVLLEDKRLKPSLIKEALKEASKTYNLELVELLFEDKHIKYSMIAELINNSKPHKR